MRPKVIPSRKVLTYWWPPSLVVRQAASMAFIGYLTRWKKMPDWMLHRGLRCLPGAAGSRGMGCIGFPSHPVWEVTARCNLNCIHCHVADRPVGDELTTEEGMKLLDQLADVREFRMMAFTGGEPLVREDIFDLLEYSQGLGFSNTMATNATMIDDTIAERLRDSGVSIAAVSLDGDRETHDSIRKRQGSFDLAVGGIRSLGNAGIPIHINITAMDMNMKQVEEVTSLSEELGASIILYYQLVPIGRGENIGDSALTKSENRELINLISDLQQNCGAIIEPVAGPQYWSYLLDKRGVRGGPILGLAEKVFHGCSAGRGFVYIKPDGEVLACPFVDVPCGNVREQSFGSIWRKSAVLEDLRKREERLKGRCGECNYRTVCGGCRGRAQAITGDYMGEDPCCFIDEDRGGPDGNAT